MVYPQKGELLLVQMNGNNLKKKTFPSSNWEDLSRTVFGLRYRLYIIFCVFLKFACRKVFFPYDN